MPDEIAPSPFVGRRRELASLIGALRSAAAGRGRAVFLVGDAGTGKQTLIDRLAAEAAAAPELAATVFFSGRSEREHAEQSPYEPFGEIFLDLVALERSEKARRAALEVLKESAPSWLRIVPVIGAGLEAGMTTALKLRQALHDQEHEERELAERDRGDEFLAALRARLARDPLLALVFLDAQWIDGPSAALLERVTRFAQTNPVAVYVLTRPSGLEAGRPLRETEDELVADDLAERVDLAGLDDAEVAEYVQATRSCTLAPDAATWLREFTDGNPRFLDALLPVLEEGGILVRRGEELGFSEDVNVGGGAIELTGRLAGIEIPRSMSRAVERRIEELERSDRDFFELLRKASVEGRRFLASTLARVADVEERQLISRLGEGERKHGLIRAQQVLQRRRYAYEFAHMLVQQAMYGELTEPERVEYHCAVASALVETFGEAAPRPVLLDIARHWEHGYDPGRAALFLLRAAQSAVLDGASPQAVSIARRGLELAREAEPEDGDATSDRVRAELVHLLATAGDVGWQGEIGLGMRLHELLEEGCAAAERAGDDELRARLRHAEGVVLVARGDAAGARRALEAAVELARRADAAGSPDAPLTQLAAMIDLGNTIDVVNLEEGLAVLHEARELYLTRILPAAGEPPPAVARLFHRLEGFIGIGEFDRGALGEARRLLDRALAGLEAVGRTYDLPRLLNYRAQIELAAGDFEGADSDLARALEGAAPGPWASYNTALRGKVWLDAERFEQAEPLLREAWEQARADWQPSLGLVVRAYLAEYLLRLGSTAEEVDEAAALAADEIAEASAGGFAYCVAWGESLASEVALRRQDAAMAVEHGARAVEILEDGDLPIVRTEEVLFRQARALAAAGSPEAAAMLERARAVVERKIATLPPEERERMRSRTPTGRALGAD